MRKKILIVLLLLFMTTTLLPTNIVAETNPSIDTTKDTINAHRDPNNEEIYFLTRGDSSTLKTGDEIAWLDSSYTKEKYTSVGVPENSGIVKIVDKSDWDAYYQEDVNFYLDVLKSGDGFDGCEHGT